MRLILVFILLPLYTLAASVKTFEVYSQSMQKQVPNTIILPQGYNPRGEALPVLYALHGATDDHYFWPSTVPKIQALADRYGIVVVAPDGAKTSWYIDSPIDKTFKYETYVSKELIAYVDNHFNVKSNKASRAIMGLSMGGFGAFYLAMRNSGIYSAAISTSGGFDLRPFSEHWDIAKRIGKQSEHPENWQQYSVVNMVDLLKGKDLKLFFDCGVDDFFYTANKQFHQSLLTINYPHIYMEMPGGHTLDYWQNSIDYHFVFLAKHFRTPNLRTQ